MITKYTPEPWRYKLVARSMQPTKVLGPPHRDGSDFAALCETTFPADACRIVACVNACSGMADPEKEIAELRKHLRQYSEHDKNA